MIHEPINAGTQVFERGAVGGPLKLMCETLDLSVVVETGVRLQAIALAHYFHTRNEHLTDEVDNFVLAVRHWTQEAVEIGFSKSKQFGARLHQSAIVVILLRLFIAHTQRSAFQSYFMMS